MYLSNGSQYELSIHERFLLTSLTNVPWWCKSEIHKDLGVETVPFIVTRYTTSYDNRLKHLVKGEALRLLNIENSTK